MNSIDCSTHDPIASVLKQYSQDRSLQQERFQSAPSSSSSFRTQRTYTDVNKTDLASDFFKDAPAPTYTTNTGPFAMSRLQQELELVAHGKSWSSEFNHPNPQPLSRTSDWQQEFHHGPSSLRSTEFSPQPWIPHSTPMTIPSNRMHWINTTSLTDSFDTQTWDAQFAAFDHVDQDQTTSTTLDQDQLQHAGSVDKNTVENETTDTIDGIGSLLQDLQDQMARPEQAYEQELEDLDENRWEDEFGTFDESNKHMPKVGSYTFEIDNPYLSHDDPLGESMAMLARQSRGDTTISLSELALALEATIQSSVNGGDSITWTYLGQVQSQNEKEVAAVRALQHAVDLDPDNLQALMSLAVSYTNESHDYATYYTLNRWIRKKYPGIAPPEPHTYDTVTLGELHDRVTDLFITAAQMAPEGNNMDPDVQVGLGILFYGRGDYTKAIDCFFTAVKSQPKDPLLWNRLGATLANHGRCEEAIEAYENALNLWPTFVRARYNIGVSCLNIGCYQEAAEHFLSALSTHKRLGNEEGINVSDNLWGMLRKALRMLGRRDLESKASPGADIQIFREAFDF
ncbi:TPR-like protein [Hesseltinella vesiculosa]|uniref:TPR-like protein n=1 Tax=Hesseltinella vesiculosa TaxID=101127 RepID=A0A1X2GXP3_9FUNG|nr:TPR-like protein [Hesseltinella vesiculosa]